MAKESETGVITLEACISVLSFLVLMLLLSGLFIMFMAQNMTAHVVLQTSESLSIDAYAAEKIGTGGKESVSEILVSVGDFIAGLFGKEDNNPEFTTREKWYDGSEKEIATTIKTRFVAYLSGGDESAADEQLERMNIVNGLDGLDFSNSYVRDNTLYIVLDYELEYDFNIWGLGKVPVKQTTCSKLWK